MQTRRILGLLAVLVPLTIGGCGDDGGSSDSTSSNASGETGDGDGDPYVMGTWDRAPRAPCADSRASHPRR